MDKVAVVVLNWNGSKILQQFLPSVIKNTKGEGRVYVADNGSTDDSVGMLRQLFPEVSIIALDKNYGFAEGYNRALQRIDAEYAVLLNSDVEVTPHWLAPLIAYMDANPDAAACQPKILSWHDRQRFEYAGAAGGFIDKYGYPFCRGRILGTVEEDHGQYDDVRRVFWATGATMFVRLSDYRNAGGLDAGFFAHMEEIDLCWRFHTRGRSVACVPQSRVYHVGAATLKASPTKTFLNFRNNLLMLYKNLPDSELRHVIFVRGLLDYVALLTFALKGQFKNAAAVFRARRSFAKLKAEYRPVRQANLRAATTTDIPERVPFSIIISYYLKGRKTFLQLTV